MGTTGRPRARRRALIALFALFGLLPATAAPAAPGDEGAGEGGEVAPRNGPYLGVAPGVRDQAPAKARVHSRGAVRLVTWVGFQMVGPGGRVFIQATEPPVYTLVPGPADEVILELSGTRLHTSNDGRRLETGWFPTAVAWVDAEQRPGDVTRVTIKLRETVGYDLRQEGNYVILDFRPPAAAVAPPQTPPPTE